LLPESTTAALPEATKQIANRAARQKRLRFDAIGLPDVAAERSEIGGDIRETSATCVRPIPPLPSPAWAHEDYTVFSVSNDGSPSFPPCVNGTTPLDVFREPKRRCYYPNYEFGSTGFVLQVHECPKHVFSLINETFSGRGRKNGEQRCARD